MSKKEEYAKSIPPHCILRTYDEHVDVLFLCWTVLAIMDGEEWGCGECEYRSKE